MKTIILIIIPYLLSFSLGYLLIRTLISRLSIFTQLFLAGGLGLGISAQLTFYSFLLFNRLHTAFLIAVHIVLISGLGLYGFTKAKKDNKPFFDFKEFEYKSLGLFSLLLLTLIPTWIYAQFYPNGGWDAWGVWNYKAKFLLLGDNTWQRIFDPATWRTSPHYPLLLPLMNVWAWALLKIPIYLAPLLTSVLFTFFTAGLIFSSLKSHTQSNFSLLASFLLVTIPFSLTLTTSQYSDVILGFYLFAALYCIVEVFSNQQKSCALLAGIFLGFLSFTKPEGLVATGLVVSLYTAAIFLEQRGIVKTCKDPLMKRLLLGLICTIIPTILFQLFYSPGNQTFVNGLTSTTQPVTMNRFLTIFVFLWAEFISAKWNGLLIVLAIGLLLSKGRCFQKRVIIIPAFLFSYLLIVLFYYFVNTQFEILWWLQVTLNRILFALLPTIIFWVFYSVWNNKKVAIKEDNL